MHAAFNVISNRSSEGLAMPYPAFSAIDPREGYPALREPVFPFGEDLLQFIWESQLFERGNLRTTDGSELEVLRPGRIQNNSGPDLSEALIRIDGQLWAGNIEVHLRTSDWNAHGHRFDHAYDNVVLHVVFEHDAVAVTSKGAIPATLELMSRVDATGINRFRELMESRAWVPCAASIHEVDPAIIERCLDRVLVERLARKALDVGAQYERLGRDARVTFYHTLLRGFGSHVNGEPFSMLAYALPLRILERYKDDPFRTEALLFGQAGLLRTDFIDEHPRRLQEEHRVLARLHQLKPAPLAAWKFGRMRPSNFPTVRIAQLAQLIARSDGAFSNLLEHDDPRELRAVLDVEAGTYWHDRYRFDRAAPSSVKRLGGAAVDGIIINAIVPFLFALRAIRGDDQAAQRALSLLRSLGPEQNTITTGWRALGVGPRSAADTQAMLELKKVHCGQRRCLSCVIGAELLRHPRP